MNQKTPETKNSIIAEVFTPKTRTQKIRIDDGAIGYLYERNQFVQEVREGEVRIPSKLCRIFQKKRQLVLFKVQDISLNIADDICAGEMTPVKFGMQITASLHSPVSFMVEVLKKKNSISTADIEEIVRSDLRKKAEIVLPENPDTQNAAFSIVIKNAAAAALEKIGMRMTAIENIELTPISAPALLIDGKVYRNLENPISTETWEWNPESGLTLNGYHGGQIRKTGNLAVSLNGTNAVTSIRGNGLDVKGDLKISGTGTLLITAESNRDRVRGILADSLDIQDATVKSVVKTPGHGISVLSSMQMQNADVTVLSKGSGFSGIYTGTGNIEITNSSLKTEAENGNGIFCGKDIIVDNAKVSASGGQAGMSARGTCTFAGNSIVTNSGGETHTATICDKLEVQRGVRFLSYAKAGAVSCHFEKIIGNIQMGDSADSISHTNCLTTGRYLHIE